VRVTTIKNQKPKITNVPIRVAFVTTNMGIGGAERLLFELITRLDRTRFEPVLVCLKERMSLGAKMAEQGVRVYSDVSRGRFDLRVVHRLAALFRKERVQVVCTVGTGGDRSFWGRLAARWAGVPVVISCPHSMGVPDTFEPSNRMLSGITDAFIAVARRQKSYLVKSEGFPAGKIRVIHNGVDLDRFTPANADPRLRASLGIPPDAPLAGLVAYLRPEKDIATFLRAAALVHERLPAAHFVIVGDGPERKKLESLTDELNLRDVVRFAGLCQDVREWVRSLDVFLLTSICEAFPVSLLEAMACEKPVIATNVGAIPEMILHGQTGFLVRPRDHAGVADAICDVLRDPAAAREMGHRARRHVEDHFSLESMVRGYEQLFVQLLERKQRRVSAPSLPSNWLPGVASLTTTTRGLG
jgi:glycosyltransferase involved in cell wall biosynthesis